MSDPSENSDSEMGEPMAMEMGEPMEMAEPMAMGEPMAMDENFAEPALDEAPMGEDLSVRDEKQPLVDRRKKAVLGVPIEVVISVGKARPLLSELVGLRRDSVLTLDSKIEDPVEIMVGDRVIARGELQEVDSETGQLCVRLTEVADLSQSL